MQRNEDTFQRLPGEPDGHRDAPEPRAREGRAAAAERLERDGLCCLTIWASGTDVSLDGVVRISATRRGADGGWEDFERATSPFARDGGATARIRTTFGVDSTDLEDAPDARDVWPELRAFVEGRPVLCHDAEVSAAWARQLDEECGLEDDPLTALVGLDEIAALLDPGYLSSLGPARIVEALVDADFAPRPAAAIQPPHVLAALGELVARFGDRGPIARAVAAWAWEHAREGFRMADPAAAARMDLALAIADRPNSWGGGVDLFAAGRLEDGWISDGLAEDVDPDDPLGDLDPAVAEIGRETRHEATLRSDVTDPAPFPDEDMLVLDDVFREHLPALFGGGRSRAENYRESQHRVAEEVARCLGSDQLLLVHAPTGTGKTLAYIVPALLWARRYGVRVGVATYTRALQSQAMEREVPRALEALASAGVGGGFRVSVLKGREHSICWRALRLHAPADSDPPEAWLAWIGLALFAMRDAEGDLDRFPRAAPVRVTSGTEYRRHLLTLLSHVHGQSGCCTDGRDKETCGAIVARELAARSHVVLTNQSFAIARPEFFRRVVFDECEHLHDQAFNAWSHRVSFEDARRALEKLHDPRARSGFARPPLDRLASKLLPGTPAHDRYSMARGLWTHTSAALARLEGAVLNYERWAVDAARRRSEDEQYALFREYVLHSRQSGELVAAAETLQKNLTQLVGSLTQLAEELEGLKLRRAGRVRRALEIARGDLVVIGEAFRAWLPFRDGEVSFSDAIFNDVERDVRERLVLAALVLLPGDFLGRHYYPELGAAAFVSATTRLGGDFERAKGYLGLDRVASIDRETGEFDPSAGTERVTTFHAPEVFDYSRVLVGVPRGTPGVRDREAFIEHLARFLPWYAERSRGRMLVLFTSLRDIRAVAERCAGAFADRGLPLLWQGMEGAGKEELAQRFRERVESTLFGVDTFWYGADFPGETLETLCIARLPYGVPDRYHNAQCAALGVGAQRRRIYMPRALAKFRQGFGRLMRRASDRGVVLVLDSRVAERRHREFMDELPIERIGGFSRERHARLVRGDHDLVVREAFAHLGLLSDMERRGLSPSFSGRVITPARPLPRAARDEPATPPVQVDPDDLPF